MRKFFNKFFRDRPYYNVHRKFTNRSTNFGYGIKYDFTREYDFY